MRTVYFIRHAKSSWEDISLRDADRPLNKRGLRDAPFMARLFRAKEKTPDLLFSSPANRALTTAGYFAEALLMPKDEIEVVNHFYMADERDVLKHLNGLDDSVNTVCIFGHNPVTTHLANLFSDDYIPNVPTCGIVKIEMEDGKWKDFSQTSAHRTAFHFPKQYFD